MAQTLTFTIKFNVDPPNVQQALDAVNTSLKNVGVSITNVAETSPKLNALDDSFTKIGLRLNGIQNLFNILTSSFGSIVAASNSAEASAVKLSQALQNQGIYTAELVSNLKAFASARQEVAAIDDDATIAVLGQLTALGLQGQALRDAAVAVQDLATLMDGDMNSAVRLVADAFQGNTAGLKRLKVEIDETALKERGAIVIIEALTKAVGGQAEAFGATSAGSMKKMQLAADDLRQSFGDLLKDALAPFTDLMRSVIQWTNSGGGATKSLALGLTGLGIAFAFVNTSMGPWPYILTATAATLLTIYKAIKDGHGYLVALAGVVGTVTLAFALLHAKAILAAGSMHGLAASFVAARTAATAFFTSLGPLGWVIIGLGAIAAAWGMIQHETKNAEEAARQYQEQIKQLSDAKLVIDVADATLAIVDLNAKVQQLKKAMREGKINASPELLGFELQLQLQRERLKLLETERVRREQVYEQQRKQAQEAASPKVQLDVAELRAKAMADGVAKELALLDIRHQRVVTT